MANITPLSDAGGVLVEQIDIRTLSGDEQADLIALFEQEGLLVLRDQQLDRRSLVEVTYVFGEPQIHPLTNAIDREIPELLVISTRGRDDNVMPDDEEGLIGQIDWHTDLAYMKVPNRAGILYGVELPPEGGMTGFIDRARTYEALPESLKQRLEGLTVIHSWRYAQEGIANNPAFRTDEGATMLELDRFPDLGYPLVYAHPVSGRKILNVTPQFAAGIIELPGAEGRALLDELIAHSLQDQFIYWHRYDPGDLAIWDNWRFMHAASGTKGRHRRLMLRTTVKGGPEFGRVLDPEHERAAAARLAAAASA